VESVLVVLGIDPTGATVVFAWENGPELPAGWTLREAQILPDRWLWWTDVADTDRTGTFFFAMAPDMQTITGERITFSPDHGTSVAGITMTPCTLIVPEGLFPGQEFLASLFCPMWPFCSPEEEPPPVEDGDGQ
jgi:hypothetical protein